MPVMLPFDDILRPTEIYVDGARHPCLCLGIDEDTVAWGVSLIDGSWPRNHKLLEAKTLKLTLREAFQTKIEGLASVLGNGPTIRECVPPFYEDFDEEIGGSLDGTEHANRGLTPGGLYEDCAYHPCLTMGVDGEQDDIWGISLIDGTWPRSCSLRCCGVVSLSLAQAWCWKMRGPQYPGDEVEITRHWWTGDSENSCDRTRHLIGRELSDLQVNEWRKAFGCQNN